MSERSDVLWVELERDLPVIIPRKHVSALTGGLISRGRLANLDSKGEGPHSKVRIGKSVCYERRDFID